MDAKLEGCAKIRLAKIGMSENWYDAKFELNKVWKKYDVCMRLGDESEAARCFAGKTQLADF